MKRLARFLSCVFLFLTIMLGLMWVRSYFYSEAYHIKFERRHRMTIRSQLGAISLADVRGRIRWWRTTYPWVSEELTEYHKFEGWFIDIRHYDDGDWVVSVPYWILFSVSLALGFWNNRNAHRQPRGHCQSCGYDLRGSGDACPECGVAKP